MMSYKSKSTLLTLTACLALLLLGAPTALAQANRQQGQQGQQGIPAEKKRSLSRIGPEDVFPGAREQEGNRPARESAAPRRRESAATPRPSPSPTPTPASVPDQSPIGPTGSSALPSPTPAVEVKTNEPATSAASTAAIPPPSWLLPLLIAVALIVLTALIYVLYKLSEKLRQGSN